MGKKKKKEVQSDGLITEDEKEESVDEVGEPEVLNEKPVKLVKGAITLAKHFELNMSGVDKYQKAYLVTRYQGQLKSKEQWSQELKKHFE